MKKKFSFIIFSVLSLSFFIFSAVGCGAVSWNQKKKWPKAPTRHELQKSQETSGSFTAVQENTHTVYFSNGSAQICSDQKVGVLNFLNNNISDFKNREYTIQGLSTGTNNKINKKYSVDRAYSVKNYLISLGVNPDNITSVGKGGSGTNNGKDRNAVITVVSTIKRFGASIPLISDPQVSTGTLAKNDNRLIPLSEPTKYPNWNQFPKEYIVKQCGPITIGWKKINKNTFNVIFSVHEALLPEGATQFMPLGIMEDWNRGNAIWPTPMWQETLEVRQTMYRRNIVCRNEKNKNLGYANINKAQRAGSCWAVRNSDIGMEKNKRDNSSCIAFFLTKNGIQLVN